MMAIAVMTRATAGFGILFFAGDIILVSKAAWREKKRSLAELFTPFVAAIILLSLYNYARFGSFFEQGYAYQILTLPALQKARDYALFGLIHLPGNLYYLFLATPMPVFKDSVSHVLASPYIEASPWGMSIFITSPYLFCLFFLSHRDKVSRLLIATSVIIAIPILLYYGIGVTQLGYRYALDFLPFVYFLLMKNYSAQRGALTRGFKLLIGFSVLFDLYLLLTLFRALSH
jgi:hypothetical protein